MRTILAALWLAAAPLTAAADDEAEFFRTHPVTVYVGYGAGGGYDLDCRLFAKYFGAHLPGNPGVVVKNQPGAGSLRLANELYTVLPKDGSAVGMIGEVLVIDQVLGDPQAAFQWQNFDWIGRIVDADPVLAVRPDAGVASVKEAEAKEVTVGVPGAGSATVLTLTALNTLLGTRFKLVSGYEGSAQIRLAVERGEVEGTGSSQWRIDRDWILRQKLRLLYQARLERDADLPEVPTVTELGRTAEERKLLAFFSSYTLIGRSILAPPGVPRARIQALRAAFDATIADPDFVADARKANLDLAPLGGEKLAAFIRQVVGIEGPLLAKAKRAAGMEK